MERQKYPVPCECGKTHHVFAGDAGSTFLCGCGKTVEVPSLGRLKASVGQELLCPELELQALLAANRLPVESGCVICHQPTVGELKCYVRCEAPTTKSVVPLWQWLVGIVFPIIIPRLLIAQAMSGDAAEAVGNDVAFDLPVRVCEFCTPTVRTVDAARQVLLRTDLYARLLEKYPHAKVVPPG